MVVVKIPGIWVGLGLETALLRDVCLPEDLAMAGCPLRPLGSGKVQMVDCSIPGQEVRTLAVCRPGPMIESPSFWRNSGKGIME